jgi:hypothetical protein
LGYLDVVVGCWYKLNFGGLLYPPTFPLLVSAKRNTIRLACHFLGILPVTSYLHCRCINSITLRLNIVGFFALRAIARRLVLHVSFHISAAKSDILNLPPNVTSVGGEVEEGLAICFRVYPEALIVPDDMSNHGTEIMD